MEKARDSSIMEFGKIQSKKEVIREEQRDNKKVHFASLIDICHLKNAKLEPKLQKYKSGIVLRGDTVKYDSGAYAVFTGQGLSTSQMTSATIMDVLQDYQECDEQAADAVSAYTQVKFEDVCEKNMLDVYSDPRGATST